MNKTLGKDGYSMIEVIVSMLLTAIMVSAVFSIAISNQQGNNRVDRRTIAAQAQRHLTELLAQYVTADPAAAQIAGPSTNVPGAASWRLNGWPLGENGQVITDSCGACYALAPGVHTLTGYLPAWFAGPPYNATISYTIPANGAGAFDSSNVSYNMATLGTGNVPKVNVTVNWTEP